MSIRNTSALEIQNSIDEFTLGLPDLEKQQFNKVYSLLKDLSLDSDGNIKLTLDNLKIIGRVKSQLQSLTNSPIFQDKISALNAALDNVNIIQTNYFAQTFGDFTKPKTIDKIQELAFYSTVDQLAGAGMQENVISMSADIVEQHIRDGSSFTTLVDELKVKMIGNEKVESRLLSYAKQTINNLMSGFARNYNAIVTDDLDLEWFEYVGALVGSSRPVCIALIAKRYIHKSELASIANGIVDGVFVGTAGLMPGTTDQNFCSRCGGFNCDHLLIPIPASSVPQEIRDKFKKL